MAVQAYGVQADWAVAFHNDVDSADGTTGLDLSGAAEGGQTFFDYSNLGGIEFTVGCYADITVTGGIIYVWIA